MKLITTAILALGITVAMVTTTANACERITAALRFNGRAYLFFRNNYIGLDKFYKQNTAFTEVYPDWGAPYTDAAVTPNRGYTPLFFADKYLFWPQYSNAPKVATSFGGDFFKDGVDAAGYINDTMVFIKGCNFISLELPLATGPVLKLPNGLPCSPDAALTEGENLILFKDDMMWILEPTGLQEEMPIRTELMITLEDVTLCSAGEEGV